MASFMRVFLACASTPGLWVSLYLIVGLFCYSACSREREYHRRLASWIRSRRRQLEAVHTDRVGVRNSVSEANRLVLSAARNGDCVRTRSVMASGACGLIRGRDPRHIYLHISCFHLRPLFFVLLHECEHLRRAIDYHQETGVDLMVLDLLGLLPCRNQLAIELRVLVRSDPHVHWLIGICALHWALLTVGYVACTLFDTARELLRRLRVYRDRSSKSATTKPITNTSAAARC
jgi:hypothetical protein